MTFDGVARLVWALVVSACLIVLMVAWFPRSRGAQGGAPAQPGERKTQPPVRSWMVIGAAAWTGVVITAVGVTNLLDGARFCEVTTVTKPEVVAIEHTATMNAPVPGGTPGSTVAPTTGSSDKRTTTPASTETTKKCRGIEVAQAALLLVPGLLFFAPALTGLDVAGLFKLSFREVKEQIGQVEDSVRLLQQTVVNQQVALLYVDKSTQIHQGLDDLRRRDFRRADEVLTS